MSEAASMAFDTTVTTRGYTNHEQIDPVGLIHMNGRVYDAELGRFISADPLVQDTTNLQSFNRFAYVFNNPLSHTDPSGFAGFGISRSTAQQFYYSYYAASLVFKKALNAPGRLAKSITGSPIMAPYTTPQSSQASSIGGTLYQAASTLAEPFVQMAAYAFGSFGTTLNDVAEEASALSYGGSFQEGFYPIVHREEAPQETRTVTSRVKSTVVRVIITARSTPTSYIGDPNSSKTLAPGQDIKTLQLSYRPAFRNGAPRHRIINLLKSFTGFNYSVGSHQFRLTSSGFKHILERHHPYYWGGPTSNPITTFFARDLAPGQIIKLMQHGLRYNRAQLKRIGDGSGQFTFRAGGKDYTLGVDQGSIKQFYPKSN